MKFRRVSVALLAACLAIPCAGVPAAAQERPRQDQMSGVPRAPGFQVYAYTLRHKPAGEALVLIRPLLSKGGTIEIQPQTNTLVVRDTLAALGRIVPALRAYDRPPENLRVEVMIVRAFSRPVPQRSGASLPPWLEERLRGLLRWDYYQVLADSGLETREGGGVSHEVGGLYGVSFEVGSLLQDERVKLNDFKIWRVDAGAKGGAVGIGVGEPLLEATLNLWLDKPKVLGLANSESSDHALMVVLTCQRSERSGKSPGRPPGGGH
jgi:hypothetical protein